MEVVLSLMGVQGSRLGWVVCWLSVGLALA